MSFPMIRDIVSVFSQSKMLLSLDFVEDRPILSRYVTVFRTFGLDECMQHNSDFSCLGGRVDHGKDSKSKGSRQSSRFCLFLRLVSLVLCIDRVSEACLRPITNVNFGDKQQKNTLLKYYLHKAIYIGCRSRQMENVLQHIVLCR